MKTLIKNVNTGRFVTIANDKWEEIYEAEKATKFSTDNLSDKLALIQALTSKDYELVPIYDSIHYE